MEIAQNILVATDFSVLSQGVVEHALALAEMLGAKLNVVTVHTHAGAVPPNNPETRALREEMAALEAQLKPSGRLGHAIIQFGEPAETILRVAKELHADMIMMGTNSRHGFSRWTTGSVAQDVLRKAQIPVLVIKKAALRAQASSGDPAAP